MIQGTLFKDAVEKFEHLIKENRVYLVSNGMVKQANKRFSNGFNQFTISFD